MSNHEGSASIAVSATVSAKHEVSAKLVAKDEKGKRIGKTTSKWDVSRRTGKRVSKTYYVDDSRRRRWLRQHVEEHEEGERTEIHAEDIPADEKPQWEWLNEQLSYVAWRNRVAVHRRKVHYEGRSSTFLLRLGTSARTITVPARKARCGRLGSRAARRRVRDLLKQAMRDSSATAT